MKYNILLFDLDDTLLDFRATEAISLVDLFASFGYTLNQEILSVYNNINQGLWQDYEKGKTPLKEVLNTRFSLSMASLGVKVDGIEWERRYRRLLGKGYILIDNAKEVCKSLSARYKMYIITNGIAAMQIHRLKKTGLYNYFLDIFASEQIGSQKPSKEFFDFVEANIAGFDKSKTLIIGDSISTDIKGGLQTGIDTCWFNPENKEADIRPTYTIASLLELNQIL